MPIKEMVKGKVYTDYPSNVSTKQLKLNQHHLSDFARAPTIISSPGPANPRGLFVIALGAGSFELGRPRSPDPRDDDIQGNDLDAYLDNVSRAYWHSVECGLIWSTGWSINALQ